MTTRAWATLAVAVGGLLLLAGLLLGYSTISRGGVGCGSAFGGTTDAAVTQDIENTYLNNSTGTPLADQCASAVSDRKPVAFALTIPGGVAAGVGVFMWLALWSGRMQRAQGASAGVARP